MLSNARKWTALYMRLIPHTCSLRSNLHDLIAKGGCLLGILGAAHPACAPVASPDRSCSFHGLMITRGAAEAPWAAQARYVNL
jgi:hypothetical protein